MLAALAALWSLAVLGANGMLHCSVRRIITVIAMTATLALEHAGVAVLAATAVSAVPAAFAFLEARAMPRCLRHLRFVKCVGCLRCVRCGCRIVVHTAPAVLAMIVVRK